MPADAAQPFLKKLAHTFVQLRLGSPEQIYTP